MLFDFGLQGRPRSEPHHLFNDSLRQILEDHSTKVLLITCFELLDIGSQTPSQFPLQGAKTDIFFPTAGPAEREDMSGVLGCGAKSPPNFLVCGRTFELQA